MTGQLQRSSDLRILHPPWGCQAGPSGLDCGLSHSRCIGSGFVICFRDGRIALFRRHRSRMGSLHWQVNRDPPVPSPPSGPARLPKSYSQRTAGSLKPACPQRLLNACFHKAKAILLLLSWLARLYHLASFPPLNASHHPSGQPLGETAGPRRPGGTGHSQSSTHAAPFRSPLMSLHWFFEERPPSALIAVSDACFGSEGGGSPATRSTLRISRSDLIQ